MFIGGQGRTHTGQAIGVLAAAIQPGGSAGGIGLSFIAAQGDITPQAQAGPLQLAAQDTVRLQSASRHIDWTAAKRIVLSVSGGASLTIDASGITVQCPGKLTVQAGQKRFVGPSTYAYEANARPGSTAFDEDHVLHWPYDGTPVINRRFEVQRADGTVVRGTTDRQGRTGLQKSDFLEAVSVKLLDEA